MQRVEQGPDEARVVHVVTAQESAAACPGCGVVSTSVKEYTTTRPKDIPYGQGDIEVRWHKTRWRCREDYCPKSSFTEAIAQIPARARTTMRLRTQIGAAIGDAGRAVAEVADAHDVSWPTAHRAFVAHAEALLCEPEPVAVLGIDETRRGKPSWAQGVDGRWVRIDPWDTGFVDLSGDQGLLGQREGRTGAAVVDWLTERSEAFRAGVQFVAIDPAAVYAAAIRTPGLLPNATIVVDHFHLVKLANDALTKVRRRVTWDLRDRRGRKADPEWANRRRLLRGRERLSDKSFAKMWNAIIDADDTGQILSAWIAKEELRTLLSTVRLGGDPHLTRHRLHRFLTWCIDSKIPELLALAGTVDTWWPEINAFIGTGITNARTEGYNRLVKQVKRAACGFRNPTNSARRIRFHCTRKQRTATRTCN
ncbi:ISL3 family transposase [Mycolicibacterium smegmatis]|uniref:ISL3 family transposase n=1 Tax=Mycolicibacterium smegmatis TaxID=1772 RepID=UPI001E498E6F|nr:ISL3 family transposase [Mycolicibacterium smegmatis]UGU29509.1 ISL3 family transposase [Mycolicibacterium smegmatis]UGU30247.1 ISL3 family transposase [Mycolicibacterium smegmatis]UGU30590.1 ISL3 family transposase [Mycolicibacterium smegmatis]